MEAKNILHFWFNECTPEEWFKKDEAFDQKIRALYLETLKKAAAGELWSWRETLSGRLAEIIVLDQFSRNAYRDTAPSFAQDAMALALAQEAVEVLKKQPEEKISTAQKAFLFMPYMHSESLKIHEQAVILFSEPGLENNLDYEWKHKKIIERFGRFPHRNKILGRNSTPEEIEFLKQPGSSF